MISDVKTDRIAVTPSEHQSMIRLGASSLFDAATDLVFQGSQQLDLALGVEGPLETQRGPFAAGSLMKRIAESHYARAERLDTSQMAWTQAGFACLANDDMHAARKAFERARSLNPEDRVTLLGLARTAHEEGRLDEAESTLRALLNENTQDLETCVSLAAVLATHGRLDEALQLLEVEVSPADPFAAKVWAAKGAVLAALGKSDAAVSYLRKAVRLAPAWVNARNALGLAEVARHRLVAAERQFRQAIRFAPVGIDAHLNLAKILIQEGRWDEIVKIIERYWLPDRAPIELAHYAGQACLELNDPRAAKTWLQAIEDKAETNSLRATILNNLGVACSRLDQTGEARRAFTQSIQAMPSETAVANLGRLLLEEGKAEACLEWLDPWPTMSGGFRGRAVLGVLASALGQAGRHDEAVVVASELASRADADESTYTTLSYLYADDLQEYDHAVEAARAGLQKWPRSVSLINNLAYSLLMMHQTEEAATWLNSTDVTSLTRSEQTHFLATSALLKLLQGNFGEGRELYERAASIAPGRSLRERAKAKRDLELGRAILRVGGPKGDAIKYLQRATKYSASARIYVKDAQTELRLLESG